MNVSIMAKTQPQNADSQEMIRKNMIGCKELNQYNSENDNMIICFVHNMLLFFFQQTRMLYKVVDISFLMTTIFNEALDP